MLAQRFMALFSGHTGAYGTYDIDGKNTGLKVQGTAITKRAPVTEQLWDGHLAGTKGIGIVPIREDNTCLFGAIDIDEYKNFDLKDAVDACIKAKAPVVVCRSKSGGAHIYMFFSEPIPAADVKRKLADLATVIGHPSCEIFPKQDQVLTERGDVGNWINMPYFEGDQTSRYGVAENGSPVQISDFLDFAESIKLTRANFVRLKFAEAKSKKRAYKDAPPCIEKLAQTGFPEGTRNNGLFNLCVLARKMKPDDWQPLVMQMNIDIMDPPLPESEAMGVIQSMQNSDYQYTCSRPPLRPNCNAGMCRMRKFGVGQTSGTPRLSSLSKYNTEPPIWFLDMDNGMRLSLSTEDLQNQVGFQKRCMEAMNYMPPKMNLTQWNQMIQALLQDVVIIEAPEDASPKGQFIDLLERYCTGKAQAKHLDEILLGKPFHDRDDNRHLFRLADFINFLDKQKFKEFKLNQISSAIRDYGGETHTYKLNGKRATVWSVPAFSFQDKGHQTPDFSSGSLI